MNLHAFEDRALPHLDAVYRLAMVLANDPHDASDIVHETYRKAMDAADQIAKQGGDFRLWLLKILRSVFSAHAGGTTRTPTSLLTNEAHSSISQGGPSVDQVIRTAISRFPPQYRSVLLLWSVEGMTYHQIAAIEDVPSDTVKRWLHHTRGVLGDLLERTSPSRRSWTERPNDLVQQSVEPIGELLR
ncbi:MAG: RNA polymerase sigma factor [Phycisphaerales bacterium]